MSNTHYYYALNRKATEGIVQLTWTELLEKYRWDATGQWNDIGGFLAYGLDDPKLPEEPSPAQIAPVLRQTLKKTIPLMTPQYFCIDALGCCLKQQPFIKADLNAEGLEDQCAGLMICAIWAFLDGEIDSRTLWGVLTLHEDLVSDVIASLTDVLTVTERRRITTVMKRFGHCRPVFKWQTLAAVRDGHTVLHEDDTCRFVSFLKLAWRKNRSVYSNGKRLLHFRDFELAQKLHATSRGLVGNCLIRYWGS
jgi:hypothetical protein